MPPPRKRPAPGSHRGRPGFAKKPKRSKGFWKQRKAVEVAPVPEQEQDSEGGQHEDHSESDEEESPSDYDRLLDVFGENKDKELAVDTSSEEEEEEEDGTSEEEEEDDGKDLDQEEEDSASEGEEVQNENEEEESGEDSAPEEESEEESESPSSEEEEEEAKEGPGRAEPFLTRMEHSLPEGLREVLESQSYSESVAKDFSCMGRLVVSVPAWKRPKTKKKPAPALALDEQKVDLEGERRQEEMVMGKVKRIREGELEEHHFKAQLLKNLRRANPAGSRLDKNSVMTPFQLELFSVLNSYKDLGFSESNVSVGEEVRFVYTAHALNHVLKTRAKILLNNAKKEKKEAASKEDDLPGMRDQGLCRPKVLIVVPFRESARRIVRMMRKLLFEEDKGGKVANRSRFDEEFGGDDTDKEEEKRGNKPDDFYETFAGNIDDGFRIGLAVTKKTLKLYADFYSSDIIIASPLGLRMSIGSAEDKDGIDYDFLSSIEVLIADQANVFAMQNWEHVSHLFTHLNLQPSRSHGADFTRVRMWALEGQSARYRQTAVFSDCYMPEVSALLSRRCSNYMGRARTVQEVAGSSEQVARVVVKVPLVFHRVRCQSVASSPDDRFSYFEAKTMPEFKKDSMFHTFVFVPSYFDYVRVRNWCGKSDLDFLEVCEYTKDKDVAKARDHFFHGETHFMLYTERVHFYRRFAVKGIRHLVFYQLPQHPHFFAELCNMLQSSDRKGKANMSVTVLYTKYDAQRLAAVVGSSRARIMVSGEKSVHMFVAGN